MENNDKRQHEERTEEDGLLYGRNVVTEYLKSGKRADTLYVSTEEDAKTVSYFKALALDSGAVIKITPPAKLNRMCGSDRHQGIALSAPFCEYVSIEDILNKASEKSEAPFIVIADGIEDPHNLGAILRTADAVGVDGVLIPRRRSCPLSATVAKTSAGAVEYVPVARIGNVAQTIRDLKEKGFWIVGADMDGTADYFDADLTGATVLVVGSEGRGISRLVRESCDVLVKIPMLGKINSLNVSVAGAVLMYESLRQRQKKGNP